MRCPNCGKPLSYEEAVNNGVCADCQYEMDFIEEQQTRWGEERKDDRENRQVDF